MKHWCCALLLLGCVVAGRAQERVPVPVRLLVEPADLLVPPATHAVAVVEVEGTAPMGFQVDQPYGLNAPKVVEERDELRGVSRFTLTFHNPPDLVAYTLAVTNVIGGVRSRTFEVVVQRPLVVQPLRPQVFRRGSFYNYLDAYASGTAPVAYQWFKDAIAIPGATNSRLRVSTNFQAVHTGNYTLLVSDRLGSTNMAAVPVAISPPLGLPGENDASFTRVPHNVYSFALQADGKIVATTDKAIGRLIRLHADGSRDTNFNVDLDYDLTSVRVQSDGGILVAGGFTNIQSISQNYLARLHPDGTVDSQFAPVLTNRVSRVVVLEDQKVLVADYYRTVTNTVRERLVRLLPNGRLDTTFDAGSGPNEEGWPAIHDVIPTPEGKLIVAGVFTNFSGVPCTGLVRLLTNGAVDTTFSAAPTNYWDGGFRAVGLAPEGRVYVASPKTLLRLLPDGAQDPTYPPVTRFHHSFIGFQRILVRADGKVYLAGSFNFLTVGSTRQIFPCSDLVRLMPDGTPDTAFDPAPGLSGVYPYFLGELHEQPGDRALLVGGYLTFMGLTSGLARLRGSDEPPAPPVFLVQPQSTLVQSGLGQFYSSFLVNGSGLVAWFFVKDGAPVQLTFPERRNESGAYSIMASNAGGVTFSTNFMLRIAVPQRFELPERLPDGRFRLRFGDQDGQPLPGSAVTNFAVWASSDVRGLNWLRLTNSLTISNGQAVVDDPDAVNQSFRFYRVEER